MNHRPFEDWLLNDQKLKISEKQALEDHLRTCKSCTALAETGLELRAAHLSTPRPGFAQRFHTRLVSHKAAERRRRLWGVVVFIAAGVVLSGWLISPYLLAFLASPAEWITMGIGYLLFIGTSVQAITELIRVLFRVTPGFVPTYIWMIFISLLAGLGLLWAVSIWRFTRIAQGV